MDTHPARVGLAPAARREDDLARTIAALCAELLQVPTFDAAGDFFAEGGDSLAAARLVALIAKQVPEIGMADLIGTVFAARSPELIAAQLHRRADANAHTAMPQGAAAPSPAECPEAVPLSPLQAPLRISEAFHAGTAKWNVVTAIHLHGALAPARLRAAIGAAVARHEALRTRITRRGRLFVQSFAAPPAPLVEDGAIADLPESARGDALRRALREEVEKPFDLGGGPLFRARLLLVDATHSVLVLAAHHIIIDGWSVSVLLRDIADAYCDTTPRFSVAGRYAAVLRGWRDAEAAGLRPSLDYWVSRFPQGWPVGEAIHDAVCIPELAWNPRLAPAVREELDAAAFRRLAAACALHGVTPFVAALAAFGAALAERIGLTDVVVGAAVSRRNALHTSELVGLFLNFVPALVPVGTHRRFLDTVLETNRLWLESIPFQDTPFAAVQRELVARRRGARTLAFAINFHNYPSPEFRIPGIASRIEHLATGHVQGDLALNIRPKRDGAAELELISCSGRVSAERTRGILRRVAATLADFAA